jgi:hypothetical protein
VEGIGRCAVFLSWCPFLDWKDSSHVDGRQTTCGVLDRLFNDFQTSSTTVKSEAGVEGQRSRREGTDGGISRNGPGRDVGGMRQLLQCTTPSYVSTSNSMLQRSNKECGKSRER